MNTEQVEKEEYQPLFGRASTEEEEDDGHDECHEEESSSDSYDDDDDDDDDDDEDSLSLAEVLTSGHFWRQHAIAIVVACLATILAVWYQSEQHSSSQLQQTHSSWRWWLGLGPARHDEAWFSKHAHLDNYQRTANISFCSVLGEISSETGLVGMDFDISHQWIQALHWHFVADSWQDDEYERVMKHAERPSLLKPGQHVEWDCLQQQQQSADEHRRSITGYSYYYKPPRFQEYYRSEDAEAPSMINDSTPPLQRHAHKVKQAKQERLKPAHISFTGFGAKFVNLSPDPVLLYWDGRGAQAKRLVGEIRPFDSLGTATTPGQSFSVSPIYDSSTALDRWVVTADDCVLYFEPADVIQKLSPQERIWYDMQKLNQEFSKHYLIHSGRAWLADFPRAFPIHPLRPAQYIGHVQTIHAGDRTYDMKVESITPRVFSIDHFLTDSECDQLIEMALAQGLNASTVYSGGLAKHQRDLSTRSSTNTWLERSTAELTDQIYRRAAHVLQIDEGLLQAPIDDHVHAHAHSLAESLQIVRYKEGEEYTAHHDFVYPSQRQRLQPTRFATLLLYLNDDFQGGQTVFPRAVTVDQHNGVSVQPVKGKAVLFYNVLPDGNVDDLSQHSSQPIVAGEKVRLYCWDFISLYFLMNQQHVSSPPSL